jgi:hypothetical protein
MRAQEFCILGQPPGIVVALSCTFFLQPFWQETFLHVKTYLIRIVYLILQAILVPNRGTAKTCCCVAFSGTGQEVDKKNPVIAEQKSCCGVTLG